MSISWKPRSPFSLPLFMLLLQLSAAAFCFYYYYHTENRIVTNTAAYENMKARIQNMNCDTVDQALALDVMKGTTKEMEDFAGLFLGFSLFLGVTAGFALKSLLVLRKRYAANSTA